MLPIMKAVNLVGALVGVTILIVGVSCRRPAPAPALRVFHAAGFAPVIRQIRDTCERDLRLTLVAEGSGSQEACRKVTELGRACDVLVLADNRLVTELLGSTCSWRIDFATDAMVLGVGARAPHVAEAEKDWPGVLRLDDVRLARVDENLGPIGYRTLLTLKLQEHLGSPGLHDQVLARCRITVDDVERLPPLLRIGEIDYAFLYRSTGVAHGIRFIELDKRVNLESPEVEYGQVEVHFAKLKSGVREMVAMRGAPIVWSIVEPRGGTVSELADNFVKYLVSRQTGALESAGFHVLAKPKFHGPRDAYARFADVAEYAGVME